MGHAYSHGVSLSLHYLDDFLLLGAPNSANCASALHTCTTLSICGELGVPIAEEKTEGPTTILTFLGIEIDSVNLQLCLPLQKLTSLLELLRSWCAPRSHWGMQRSVCKWDLLSLIGHLNHAAAVVRLGCTFIRILLDASTTFKPLDHHIHLSMAARADLCWWFTHSFVPEMDSHSSVLLPPQPSKHIYMDASGSWAVVHSVNPDDSNSPGQQSSRRQTSLTRS